MVDKGCAPKILTRLKTPIRIAHSLGFDNDEERDKDFSSIGKMKNQD